MSDSAETEPTLPTPLIEETDEEFNQRMKEALAEIEKFTDGTETEISDSQAAMGGRAVRSTIDNSKGKRKF